MMTLTEASHDDQSFDQESYVLSMASASENMAWTLAQGLHCELPSRALPPQKEALVLASVRTYK